MSRTLSFAELFTHTITDYMTNSERVQQCVCGGCQYDSPTADADDDCPAGHHWQYTEYCAHPEKFLTFRKEIMNAVTHLLGNFADSRAAV